MEPSILENAIKAREELIRPPYETGFRLYNGFAEGNADLVLDVYGRTLVVHDYTDGTAQNHTSLPGLLQVIQGSLRWLRAGILKQRNEISQQDIKGKLFFGESPDTKIIEHGVWYALDLTMNRDASFYLDTRMLRKWLINNSRGKSVLNTFAYTGSLGVASLAGGAGRVVQEERSRKFLNVAERSYSLNNLPFNPGDISIRDFFPAMAGFKYAKQRFDGVILDPPFFSTTTMGKVDQVNESGRLINKVRPLINDGGWLVAINNALYVSGRDYIQMLEGLCKDGYMKIRELIPVPDDVAGVHKVNRPITDPAPFNHSTKIAILDVKRK